MFEAFLLKYPNDKRWTPDAMFRLAELYYEKSAEEYLDADEAYKKALDGAQPARHAAAAGRLHADHQPLPAPADRVPELPLPRRRLLPARLLPGRDGRGDSRPSRRCWRWSAPTGTSRSTRRSRRRSRRRARRARRRRPTRTSTRQCTPVRKESKFIPEAWTRVGEFHFDNPNELRLAIAAFRKVLTFKDSPYYDRAMYKLAWSYYRDNRFPEAVREFDNLVKYADARTAAGQKVGSDLRPEAVQYLGVSFGEPDWDGDTLPDSDQRPAARDRASTRAARRSRTSARCSSASATSTSTRRSTPTRSRSTRRCCSKWPYYVDAPRVQDRIVHAYEKDRNLVAAAKERETLGRPYTKGSDWYQHNKDNPEALAVARQLAEDALLTAATNVHAAAQACKGKWLENQKDTKKLEECKKLYATSAELYEKFLAAYPNSKRSYEFAAFYADALYYSGQLQQAITAYKTVRDSQLDNRYQEDAAFRMIKTYEEIIDDMKRSKQIEDPPIPDEKNTKPPVIPLAMPDVYKKYLEAIDWYVDHIKNDRIPDLKYAAAVITLRYRDWPTARQRLSQIAEQYCGTKSDVGFKAYDAILQTYFIDYLVQDEEQKDCALGQLLSVAEQFGESACGKSAAAKPYLARIAQIKSSVKTTIITKRLQLSMENEEKGTKKELVMCQRDRAASRWSPAWPAPTPKSGDGKAAPAGKLSTELDVGTGAGPHRRRQREPERSGRAHGAQQRLRHLREAVPVRRGDQVLRAPVRQLSRLGVGQGGALERLAQPLPVLRVRSGGQGLPDRRAGPKFAQSEHRKEALGLAASMLDNDQQYARAADLYKKYSDAIADKPQDSAQAYFFACNAYEKANDLSRYNACLKDFIKRYDKQPAAGEFVVQAYMKQAVITERSTKNKTEVLKPPTSGCATSSSRASCRPRRRRPASPPRPTS